MSHHRDSLGVEILPTDTVCVNGYGDGARLVDTGTKSKVVSLGIKRVNITDSDGFTRAVGPNCLAVMRRDGVSGFEGNRTEAEA